MVRRDDAAVVADTLIAAEVRGVTSHGLIRLPVYLGNIKDGSVSPTARPILVADGPTAATIDVSFISLDKILPPLKRILPIKGAVIALIKPQFEAGRAQVGKKGIVYDASVHRDVLLSVLQMAERNDFHMHGLTCSPITGSKGNVEFLVHWVHQHSPRWSSAEIKRWIERTVTAAHETGQDSRMR